MLFMNEHALHSLLNDKFKLGADASVAAGPVGRQATADTDLQLNAEILTYSRNKGVSPELASPAPLFRLTKVGTGHCTETMWTGTKSWMAELQFRLRLGTSYTSLTHTEARVGSESG